MTSGDRVRFKGDPYRVGTIVCWDGSFWVVRWDGGAYNLHYDADQLELYTDLDFFKSIKAGECACKIPKRICRYHNS